MTTLTHRLQQVADLVPAGSSMADIGTDHGYIPIYLVEKGTMKKAIACDIHQGPLDRAKEHLISSGLQGRINLRLGGGLQPLRKREVEGVTICGMGGFMIRQILEEDMEKAQALSWLILQPQNHVAELKQFLSSHHFCIPKEMLCLEGGQLYEIMKVEPGNMKEVSLLEAEIGVTEAYRKDPLFPMHIQKLMKKRNFLIQGVAEDSNNEKNLAKRKQALKEMEVLKKLLVVGYTPLTIN